jgi:HSP20 family protein
MYEQFGLPDSGLLAQFRRMEQELDELFSSGTAWNGIRNIRSLPAGSFPAVNVGATPEAVTVYLFAPGIDPKTLEMSIQQNLLSISGRRELPEQKEANYYRQERFNGTFRRVVSLPEDVDPDRVTAKYVDGIVHVSIARRESAKPRQIAIN